MTRMLLDGQAARLSAEAQNTYCKEYVVSRVWSVLVVVVACLVAVNFASAQEKKHGKGGHMDPEARWAAICKAVDKADADKLTADEFVDGFVKSIPDSAHRR